jgi:hypothetical protein
MRVVVLLLVVGALLAGCDKKESGSAASSSASGAPAATAAPAAAPASGGATKLTQKELDDAYKAKNMMDPFDKQLATVEAKIGKAQKVDGDTYYWWGWDAASKTCYQLDMNKTKGNSLGGTSEDKCGMKK